MFRLLKLAAAVLAAIPVITTPGVAQNWRLNPSYGSATLNAGFMPDPRMRSVQAGGNIRINPIGGCPGGGYVANAPDYRVHYRAGGFALSFYVRAPGDTLLLINDPQARWYCNDDYSGLDPAIRFGNPMSGQYDVWVGTYGRNRVRNATLYITELGPFSR
ncbi:MAG: peptidase S1 [Pararhodobacter sp.]|nr:peptidase S1 [Pararhodobacter sp.]